MGLGKKFTTFAAVVGVTVMGGSFAFAETDSQTLSYSVNATRTISLSSATASISGISKTGDSNNSMNAGYVEYTTDSGSDKITATLNEAMETNLTLKVSLEEATLGAGTCTNNGAEQTLVTLSTTEASVITGINACTVAPKMNIQYELASGAGSATPGSYTKTVTYEIKAT